MNQTSTQTSEQYSVAPRGWRESQILRRLQRLQTGTLFLTLPGQRHMTFSGRHSGPQVSLEIHSLRVVNRLLWSGDTGFAEGYIRGEWDSPDPAALLTLLQRNADALSPETPFLQALYSVSARVRHRLRRNSRRGSRRNIAYHYDLGNDFYRHWLDETWSYSGALFASPEESLATAQRRKYRSLLSRIAPQPGDHILEIGCGWGGFAIQAARETGCRVTGVTLSTEQLCFAREQARKAGLEDRVAFLLCDYRDIEGQFDHVVSIEMIEAVGEAYWPTYFRTIRGRLKPGGKAVIQAITIDDSRFEEYRRDVDFIQAYIFPGGMLPSPQAFRRAAGEQGLVMQDTAYHGQDYVRTLQCWDADVVAARNAIESLYDERFWRMWRYYLAYCAAGFATDNIDLMHTTLVRS